MKYENNNYSLIGFGERLKEARKKANYYQIKLAKMVNVSRSLINKYEQGILRANFTVIAKIAVILNVSLDWLAYGKKGD